MIEPKSPYVITHPQDNEGETLRYRFILTMSKPIKDKLMAQEIVTVLTDGVPGIDQFNILGRYTLEIVVAQTFDPEEVTNGLKQELDRITSGIITA